MSPTLKYHSKAEFYAAIERRWPDWTHYEVWPFETDHIETSHENTDMLIYPTDDDSAEPVGYWVTKHNFGILDVRDHS